MAVVFMEGFDHMIASLLTAKGWSANPTSMVAGRFGLQAATISGTGAITKVLPSTYSTLYGGFAFKATAAPAVNTDIYSLVAAGTAVFKIGVNASNQIIVRNSANTVIATGTTALVNGSWYYIEFKAVEAGASGSCEIHLNGASGEIATTTGNFGSTAFDSVRWGGLGGITVDDMYALDTTGAAPRNTFLGDVRIATVMPNADGAHTAWTPSVAGSHFSKVNEMTGTFPDGDTTYVSDATPGDIDSYVVDDIDGGATVYGVQTNLYARKDDANTRQIAPLVRQSSTDFVGTTVTLGSTYAFFTQIYNQDPTPADWTAGNVNADEFGVKEIA